MFVIKYLECFLFIQFISCISTCDVPSFSNLNVQLNFNLTKFLGVWFEIKWLPGEPHSEYEIWRSFYQIFQLNNTSSEKLLAPGKAHILNQDKCFSFGPWVINTNNGAKMTLEKQIPDSSKILNWPYYVLKTDYEHYALIYGCMSENYVYTNPCLNPILWVYGRTTILSNEYSIEIDNIITNTLCVNLSQLEITPHDGISCYSLSSMSRTMCNMNLIFLTIFLLLKYI